MNPTPPTPPRTTEQPGAVKAGPYYTLRGFNAHGQQVVAMTIFAASASIEDITDQSLLMLKDGGYECATATVVDLPKSNEAYRAASVTVTGSASERGTTG